MDSIDEVNQYGQKVYNKGVLILHDFEKDKKRIIGCTQKKNNLATPRYFMEFDKKDIELHDNETVAVIFPHTPDELNFYRFIISVIALLIASYGLLSREEGIGGVSVLIIAMTTTYWLFADKIAHIKF